MTSVEFATFWHGSPLSRFEISCINSFVAHGHRVTVYSYDNIPNLPKNVVRGNAREITSQENLNKFLIGGKPSIEHFTDLFRLHLFQKTNHIWLDADVFLLRPFDLDTSKNIIGFETEDSLCNAVLKLRNDDKLEKLLHKTESLAGQNIMWGATGPKALTSIYGEQIKDEALPRSVFYPVHYEGFYKPFLPEYFEDCKSMCKDSYTLHLWNHLINKMGVFKEVGPPEGSYLHMLFKNTSFDNYYPANIMRTLVYNQTVKIGRDAGIKKVWGHMGSAIMNSIRRRIPS